MTTKYFMCARCGYEKVGAEHRTESGRLACPECSNTRMLAVPEKEVELSDEEIRMTWGKYKGRLISELPTGYLQWVAANWEEKTPRHKKICEAADAELQWRKRYGVDK